MTKLNLGTIGTSSITNLFIKAAHLTNKFQLHAVYSRSIEKGKQFAEPHEAKRVYDNLDEFLHDPELDVIYIASPNSLHYQQTIAALEAGKHVLVEKPAFTHPTHWDHVEKLANEKDRLVIEAVRHIHEPNFQLTKKEIARLNEIQGATLFYMKYSSRYDLVRAGEEPNIFSPKLAGGALMDLGVYPLYAALAWFGEPEEAHYFAQKIETKVDGKGTAILRYPNFDVTLIFGKTATATVASEIYGLDATIRLDHVTFIESIEKVNAKTLEVERIETEPVGDNPLYNEAEAFAKLLQTPDDPKTKERVHELMALAKAVSRTLYTLRKDADISFASDK